MRDDVAMAARAFLVLVILLASAGAASAETTEGCESTPIARVSQTSRPTGIGADLGLASAVGFAGLTITRAFLECFRIELGGGAGYTGWQLSLMPKLAFDMAHGAHYLVIGAGLSVTFPYDTSVLTATTTGHPVWLNVDALGYEVRDVYGLSFACAVGVTRGLGGGQVCRYVECSGTSELGDVAGVWSLQTRIQVAYWF